MTSTLFAYGTFGMREAATTGLTFGYSGGAWPSGTATDGTVTLADNATNYLVVERATSLVTASTNTTNWNNTTAYARLFRITTAGSAIVGIEDRRAAASFGAGVPAWDAGDIEIVDPSNAFAALTVEGALAELAARGATRGKHDVPIEAGAMHVRATNGATGLQWLDMGAGKPEVAYLSFDPTTQQFAVFALKMPKSWNEATITFSVDWMHPTTTVNFGVVFGLSAAAFGDGDGLNVSFGAAQTVTDVGGTADTAYTTPESAAITIANTPATRDAVLLQLSRNPADASDTLAVGARVLRVTVYLTTDADTDA